MRQNSFPLGQFLLTCMVVGLSLLFMLKWHTTSRESQRAALQLTEALESFRGRLDMDDVRSRALLRSLKNGQDEIRLSIEKGLAGIRGVVVQDSAFVPADVEEGEPSEPQDAGSEDLRPLPPAVSRMDLVSYLKKIDVAEFLDDPRVNPDGKPFNRLKTARANLVLSRAKAEVDVLENEVRLRVLEGQEELRERGEFLEYPAGERFNNPDRVLTLLESIGGGASRMFYFYEDEYPEMYEKRRRRGEVAENAMKALLAIVDDQSF